MTLPKERMGVKIEYKKKSSALAMLQTALVSYCSYESQKKTIHLNLNPMGFVEFFMFHIHPIKHKGTNYCTSLKPLGVA